MATRRKALDVLDTWLGLLQFYAFLSGLDREQLEAVAELGAATQRAERAFGLGSPPYRAAGRAPRKA